MAVEIVRSTPAGTDAYGDPLTATETRICVDGCIAAPRVSNDVNGPARQGVVIGVTLYAPPGTDIRYTDRVDIDGTLYEVDGEPGVWPWLSGGTAGVEVALKRAAG